MGGQSSGSMGGYGQSSMGRQSYMPRFGAQTQLGYRPGYDQPAPRSPTPNMTMQPYAPPENYGNWGGGYPQPAYPRQFSTGGPEGRPWSGQFSGQGGGSGNPYVGSGGMTQRFSPWGGQTPQGPSGILPGDTTSGVVNTNLGATPYTNQAPGSAATTNPANIAQGRQNALFMSDWGGSGNVFDDKTMRDNGWGFQDVGNGRYAWNGPVPDEFKYSGVIGDGFTGVDSRNGGFMVNGRGIQGENYLGGRLDPSQAGWLDAIGTGGTMRNALGTLGFIGRGTGGSSAGMFGPGPASTATAPPPAATRPNTPQLPFNPTPGLPTGNLQYPGGGNTRTGGRSLLDFYTPPFR